MRQFSYGNGPNISIRYLLGAQYRRSRSCRVDQVGYEYGALGGYFGFRFVLYLTCCGMKQQIGVLFTIFTN